MRGQPEPCATHRSYRKEQAAIEVAARHPYWTCAKCRQSMGIYHVWRCELCRCWHTGHLRPWDMEQKAREAG